MLPTPAALFESNLKSLPLLRRGKVRDLYALGEERLLIVASDRLSAFDVVLADPIPGKGAVLTGLSNFWFELSADLVSNHLLPVRPSEFLTDPAERRQVEGRSMVVRRLTALPIEAVVRGYLAGSGWKDYRQSGAVCGIPLSGGLRQAEQLPEPIFTPATKAERGEHDENISFAKTIDLLGKEHAEQVRDIALKLYLRAARYARERGIIIADTKFEFGIDKDDTPILMDEVLTPDSSRFWPVDSYRIGISPPSFDKQFVRDYLEGLDWNKKPPVPPLPPEIIAQTAKKYREAQWRILGGALEPLI